jgi:ankyrin repeat protein
LSDVFTLPPSQILLQAGHDANALDMHRATPLHRAAASGSLPTASLRCAMSLTSTSASSTWALQVQLLLKSGARLDLLDKFGSNAYGWAVKYGHTHLLPALRPNAAGSE